MTKPNFETGMTDLFNSFQTIDEKQQEELQKEDTTSKEEPMTKEMTIPEKNTSEKSKKQAKKDNNNEDQPKEKKYQIYSEVDKVVCDYIELKATILKGEKSKKDILNEIFKEEIKKTFDLSDKATDEEMQKAIDKKMNQIEGMKNLFK